MEIKATVTAKAAIFDGKAPEIVRTALESVMYEATQYLERQVKEKTPRGVYGAQGGLVSTVHGEVEKGQTIIKGVVAHGSKYGDVIEKGRTAGKPMPPAGTLLRWIEVKMGLDEKEARRIEYVVRRKIGHKGFEGAKMFGKAFDENFSYLEDMFNRAGFEIARELSA